MINPIFKDNYTTLVMNCSNEYVQYLDVCLQSVLDNSNIIENYDIVILESTISDENKSYLTQKYTLNNFKIRFFNPSSFFELDNIASPLPGYSKESFYKIIVPKLFSKYSKVIYSDIDIIFECNISEISQINMSDSPIAATRDFALIYRAFEEPSLRLKKYLESVIQLENVFDYFAAGLYIYNIKNFNTEDVDNLLDLSMKRQYWLQEQDVFNLYFNGKIFECPYKYCINTAYIHLFNEEFLKEEKYINEYYEAVEFPKVIHYSGPLKPWNRISNEPYDQIWWKYANKSKFKNKLILDAVKKEREDKEILKSTLIDLVVKSSKYIKYKNLSKITFGKKRQYYQEKFMELKNLCKKIGEF